MKKYLLFNWNSYYYHGGGWDDFYYDYDSLKEIKQDNEIDLSYCNTYQIVDRDTKDTVYEFNREKFIEWRNK